MFIVCADVGSAIVPKCNGKEIQQNLILANIKNLLLAFMAIN